MLHDVPRPSEQVGALRPARSTHVIHSNRALVGLLLAVASGSVYAATTAFGSTLLATDGVDPFALTTVATTVGATGLVPVALLGGGPFLTSDPTTLGTLAYLGIFTMALAYGLFYAGLRTTRSGAAVVATLLEPVTAAIAAAVVLRERLGPTGIVGSVLILAAVAGLDEQGRPEEPGRLDSVRRTMPQA